MIAPGILLTATTHKLQAFLSGAAATTNPTVTVIYYDLSPQIKEDNSLYRGGPQFTVLAGATETDICAAPSQGNTRLINYINIYNADSATVTVTVCVDDNGTNRIQVKQTILTLQTLFWTATTGWAIL